MEGKMKKVILILFILISLSIYSNEKKEKVNVKLGIDVFLEKSYKEYKGKKNRINNKPNRIYVKINSKYR